MTTDFTYGNKAITTSGPTKPATVDSPNDLRTRAKTFADIRAIPMPYVGMIVTVLADETNNGKMTDYKVLSLKANNLGIPNTVINEVERYVDYLGASSNSGNVSQEDIKAAVNDYLEENPVQSGATEEQAQQLQTAYEHSQSSHVSMNDVNNAISSAVQNIEGGGGEVSEYTGLVMDILGDSITARGVYQEMIKEQLGFSSVLNHGIGGTCISGDNENCYWHDNRINALDENADVIVVTGGSNDWMQGHKLGDRNSTDNNTLYGACKTMFKKLIQKYPKKLIVAATPIYLYCPGMSNQINGDGQGFSVFVDAFIDCAKMYNIPVADVFYNCGINNYNKEHYFGDVDGTKKDDFAHPNKAYGHMKIANIIVKKLKELKPVSEYIEYDPNTYGNVIVSTNELTANEGTNDTTFTVYLDAEPSTTQTVTISADNQDVTFSPSSLRFTASNYSEPQTVTINIMEDADADNDVASITVASKSNSKYITLNITDLTTPEAVENVSLSTTSKSMYIDDTLELTATITPESAGNKNVTWSVDNSNVTLNPNGLKCTVTGAVKGSSVITVTTEDGNKTATCNITVLSQTVEIGENMFSSASKILYRINRTQSGSSYDDETNTFSFNLESGNMTCIAVPCQPNTSYTVGFESKTGIQSKYSGNIYYYSGEPTYVQHEEETLISYDSTLGTNDLNKVKTITTPINCTYIGVGTYANTTGEGSFVGLTCVQNA